MTTWNEVTLDDDQHIEMMAAVIAAGVSANPVGANDSDPGLARYVLGLAREIVRQNREPKP